MRIEFTDPEVVRELRGDFYLRVSRGREVLQEISEKNLIVQGGKTALATLLASSDTNKKVNRIGFGSSSTSESGTDTSLTDQYVRLIDSYSYPAYNQVTLTWSLPGSENNGATIREFGLFCADSTLFSRKVISSTIGKQSDVRLDGTWTISF